VWARDDGMENVDKLARASRRQARKMLTVRVVADAA
jgi:hypothetical protein